MSSFEQENVVPESPNTTGASDFDRLPDTGYSLQHITEHHHSGFTDEWDEGYEEWLRGEHPELTEDEIKQYVETSIMRGWLEDFKDATAELENLMNLPPHEVNDKLSQIRERKKHAELKRQRRQQGE